MVRFFIVPDILQNVRMYDIQSVTCLSPRWRQCYFGWATDGDHIAQIIELVGEFSKFRTLLQPTRMDVDVHPPIASLVTSLSLLQWGEPRGCTTMRDIHFRIRRKTVTV